MKITTHINPLSEQETYQIILETSDNLVPEDIVECFKHQYPKKRAAILFSKIKQIEIGIMIIF